MGYKGDFLYRTTDFAIWTTVEVGVGITAGCIATLRPLLKASLGTTGQSSGPPWSKVSKNKFGDNHGEQPLGTLRPAVGKLITTTTVTGGRVSSESDEETFLGTGVPSKRWKCGINKTMTTTVVEERAASRLVGRRLSQTTNRGRSCSPGGDSESTLGDEERENLAGVYERF